tara:strand:+ start:983 stop:1480 length:498 start_codon:yes stop_codon:yes gene_type:complete
MNNQVAIIFFKFKFIFSLIIFLILPQASHSESFVCTFLERASQGLLGKGALEQVGDPPYIYKIIRKDPSEPRQEGQLISGLEHKGWFLVNKYSEDISWDILQDDDEYLTIIYSAYLFGSISVIIINKQTLEGSFTVANNTPPYIETNSSLDFTMHPNYGACVVIE